MANYRAMAIFENESALPEDRFVNTWHFTHPGPIADAADRVEAALTGFYNAGATGTPLATFMSGKIKRTAAVSEFRVYNLADLTPREPEIRTWTLEGGDSTQDLPNEVACCLSFYADRNIPRNRGRVFLGPLKILGVGNGVADAEVGANLKGAVFLGLDVMRANLGSLVWCVRSEMDNVLRPVTDAWVDNAWDTQRRRGSDPTVRWTYTWPPVG
jgi:hypothetical protein